MKIYYCDIEVSMQIIGGKWKTLILFHLIKGPKRTSELKRLVQSITQKMLIQTLRELEADGIITREIYQQVPPKVEYSVTELGQSLEPILRLLCQWGENYVEKTFAKGEAQALI